MLNDASRRDHGNRLSWQLPKELRSFVSHELRAPLTCVDGALRLMSSDDVQLGHEQVEELIAVARNSAQRLVLLVDKLLDEPSFADVQSAPGLASKSQPVSKSFMPPTANAEPKALQVLMVEDDSDYFRFIRQLLDRSSNPRFVISRVGDVGSIRQHASANRLDLILLDLSLPDSEGVQTVRAVRALCPRVPILVLTGINDEEVGLQALAEGAEDYLVKHHLGQDTLLRCIRYAVTRKKFEESTMRLAAISDFTNALTHDLTVPLTAAQHVLEALGVERLGPLTPQQDEAISALYKSNKKQLELVQRLLEVYSYELMPQDMPFEWVNLSTMVGRAIGELEKKIPNLDRISLQISADLPEIKAYPQALIRLLLNLIENAMVHGDRKREVRIYTTFDAGVVSLHIHNWGTPIPQPAITGMFERFWNGVPGKTYVTKSGIGLYQAQRIAMLHGGKVLCESTEQKGTTLTVELPIAEQCTAE